MPRFRPVSEHAAETETGGPGRQLGPARLASIAVGVVLLALVILFALGSGTDEAADASTLLGDRAPVVAGETLDGGTFNIDDHRGSWVLVNFFATWCPGCIIEHDDLVELETWGAERGDLQLVAVVFNDPPDRVQAFFDERGGTWPVLNEPSVPLDYRVSLIPESFLVSPDGRIVLHIEGEVQADDIKRVIEGQA
jgi:cytochrome c biogenesis protein CcmG/thiol:disulfide interchange protein DsbE